MDPLSISSSVIAIATLAAQVCSKLSELRTLYKCLPGRLHAVNNEVADLGVLLLEFAFVTIVYKLTAACRAGRAPISIHIRAGTDRFRAKYDNKYTDGDFADRLRQRPDFTEKLAIAVDELLSVINQQAVADQSSDSLMEAGFFSCFPSRVNSRLEDMLQERSSAASSDGSFADVSEYLSIC
ncbi:hypothetical protein AAWM_10584 [Aspergillus awamori]|uniref:Fungal N-terminal domain-containing protein n=1 Tax=Aspergillus awamori TaxID=105351 RepID=A0A401L853_ASPAW|nr:hypothetical protein AAWM_10584 [Aspergillus awamori]